jgi:hypothetical protein
MAGLDSMRPLLCAACISLAWIAACHALLGQLPESRQNPAKEIAASRIGVMLGDQASGNETKESSLAEGTR